jgi:RimJ/RimL family protein N-acetyltransferase
VTSTVSSSNKSNLELCLKVGFKECGRYKNVRFENGKRYDEIHLQITKEEFYEKYPDFNNKAS